VHFGSRLQYARPVIWATQNVVSYPVQVPSPPCRRNRIPQAPGIVRGTIPQRQAGNAIAEIDRLLRRYEIHAYANSPAQAFRGLGRAACLSSCVISAPLWQLPAGAGQKQLSAISLFGTCVWEKSLSFLEVLPAFRT